MIAQTAQTAADDWDWLRNASVVGAALGLVGVIVTMWVNSLIARRRQRRERYAAMAATLAAWIELPFMIRRRTSNDKAAIDHIVTHIQGLQHQLTVDHAELRSDCRWLAKCRDEAQHAVQAAAKPYIDEAWNLPPISSTSELVIGEWGPTDARCSVEAFVDHLRWRFGWRWVLNPARRLTDRVVRQARR